MSLSASTACGVARARLCGEPRCRLSAYSYLRPTAPLHCRLLCPARRYSDAEGDDGGAMQQDENDAAVRIENAYYNACVCDGVLRWYATVCPSVLATARTRTDRSLTRTATARPLTCTPYPLQKGLGWHRRCGRGGGLPGGPCHRRGGGCVVWGGKEGGGTRTVPVNAVGQDSHRARERCGAGLAPCP
jgi:hypothetical protein